MRKHFLLAAVVLCLVMGCIYANAPKTRSWSGTDTVRQPGARPMWTANLLTKFKDGKLYYQLTVTDNFVLKSLASVATKRNPFGDKPYARWAKEEDDKALELSTDLLLLQVSPKVLKNVNLIFYDQQGFKVDELLIPEVESFKIDYAPKSFGMNAIPVEWRCADSQERKSDIDSSARTMEVRTLKETNQAK